MSVATDHHVTIFVMLLFIVYGAALLDHALIGAGFDEGALIGNIDGQYNNNHIICYRLSKGWSVITE